MDKHVLHIARVIEVNGSRIIGELETSVTDLYRSYKSRKYAVGQIGSIVRIEVGNSIVFGIITSLRMKEEPIDDDLKRGVLIKTNTVTDSKWIEIELFGQGEKIGLKEEDFSFQRGISTYPLPGHEIRLATVEELKIIYAQPNTAVIKIGSVAQVRGLPAYLLVDNLLGKHFSVLGTTGSGKSCTVALIFQSILRECPHAHIILLDPHNEYPRAFPDLAEFIDPTTLQIPHWVLNFQESIELFVGKTEYAATSQTNILKDAILDAKKKFPDQVLEEDQITVDSPVPYHMSDVQLYIETNMPKSSNDSWKKIYNKIETLQLDKRFSFMIQPDEDVSDNMVSLLSNLFRIPNKNKPLSIIDLSGVPSDVVDVVVSVLCRMIFDFALWNQERHKSPMFLVCEEAHRYIPKKEEAAFQPTKQALSRIAKEGRKYGVGLCLVTQRPSELSETILSQCNTIIALRMSNQQDQDFVKKSLPDNISSLVNTLPALQNREALVMGEGTVVPIRVFFDEIEEAFRPKSSDPSFAEPWNEEITTDDVVKDTVRNWREQNREVKAKPAHSDSSTAPPKDKRVRRSLPKSDGEKPGD